MPSQNPRVVAIVDDDPAVRDSFRFLLETYGFAVETYASAAEFLARAELPRLACLVLDQQMPGTSGLDLLARLHRRGLDTPTLMIVSTAAQAIAARAAQFGALGVLEKPLTEVDLLNRIEAVAASA